MSTQGIFGPPTYSIRFERVDESMENGNTIFGGGSALVGSTKLVRIVPACTSGANHTQNSLLGVMVRVDPLAIRLGAIHTGRQRRFPDIRTELFKPTLNGRCLFVNRKPLRCALVVSFNFAC